MQPSRISLTLSLHVSQSFIASGRSSGLHPVSSHSCFMYVRADRPAFDWPYAGVHRSTSLTSSSLLLQQCPACLVRLAWIVFVFLVGDRIVGALWGVAGRTCSILVSYIYIYIVIHRQTVSFYQNSSNARSRDRNPSNFTLDCVSDHSFAKGILRYLYF